MENERFGLIAAKLHNMLGGKKAMQPGDFFTTVRSSKKLPKKAQTDQLEQFYSGMMAICNSGGKK